MLSPTHPFFQTFVRLMERVAQHEPIYDLGTSSRFAKEMGFVEHLFQGKAYIAGGYHSDPLIPHACDIDCDVQDLKNIPTESAGSMISLEVLEHVQDPVRCIAEAHRVLKRGGICLLSTPFMTGYHGKTKGSRDCSVHFVNDHASYADYWRFTHEGLIHLFTQAGFSSIQVFPINGPISARLELLKLGKILQKIRFLTAFIQKIEQPRLGKLTTRHFVLAIK